MDKIGLIYLPEIHRYYRGKKWYGGIRTTPTASKAKIFQGVNEAIEGNHFERIGKAGRSMVWIPLDVLPDEHC